MFLSGLYETSESLLHVCCTNVCVCVHAYDCLARYSTINPTLPSHLSGFSDCSLVVCMPNGLFSVMFLLDVCQFAWYCVQYVCACFPLRHI